jgi:rhodanese-related sulfurtransferase
MDQRMTIDDVLRTCRDRIEPRVEASDLDEVRQGGGLVVDIRPVAQRERDGELPGALVVDRNVLEWRLDPASPHRLPEVRDGQAVVIVCNEGYASTLAAATLRDVGVPNATDLVGGYQAYLRHQSERADYGQH